MSDLFGNKQGYNSINQQENSFIAKSKNKALNDASQKDAIKFRAIYIDDNNSIRIINIDNSDYPLSDVMRRLSSTQIEFKQENDKIFIYKDEDGFLYIKKNSNEEGTLGYYLRANGFIHSKGKKMIFSNWKV